MESPEWAAVLQARHDITIDIVTALKSVEMKYGVPGIAAELEGSLQLFLTQAIPLVRPLGLEDMPDDE